MKKIIAIIALFVSVFAYGQRFGIVTDDYDTGIHRMVVGDYTSENYKSEKGGYWWFFFKTNEEEDNFRSFLNDNLKELMEKYNLVLGPPTDYVIDGRKIGTSVYCYDKDALEKSREKSARAREKAEQEKKARMESLITLL